jgi:hypothetical protein
MLLEAVSKPSASDAEASRAVAHVLARALRLLLAQLQVLKVDSANGRLTLLSATLTPEQAVEYAVLGFARRVQLPTTDVQEAQLHAALPITADFAASSPSAQHIEQLVTALSEACHESGLPAQLRTGRVANSAAAPPPGSLLAKAIVIKRAMVDSWQARFRCALAALLLQPVDFEGNPSVPEVLGPYGGQLDAAKVCCNDPFEHAVHCPSGYVYP